MSCHLVIDDGKQLSSTDHVAASSPSPFDRPSLGTDRPSREISAIRAKISEIRDAEIPSTTHKGSRIRNDPSP